MALITKVEVRKLVVDKDIRDAVGEQVAREDRHSAKIGGNREGCDFASLQRSSLDALTQGNDADGMGALTSKRDIERPIYVWRRGEQLWVVDGFKTIERAKELGREYVDVQELEFADVNEAKAWRWYFNVAAARHLPEDARVLYFLEKHDWLIKKWRDEGKINQGKKRLSSESEKVNWRERVARLCQTTLARVNDVFILRQTLETLRKKQDHATDEELRDLVAEIKGIEDDVLLVRSGTRTASGVNSDRKGNATRASAQTKGTVNQGSTQPPSEALTAYDPSRRSQLIVADSLDMLKTLPQGAFKYLVGSPPYYGANINYGVDIPWVKSWDKYCEAIKAYLGEAHRIIPQGGGIILNVDNTRDRETQQWYYHTDLIRRICSELGMYDAGEICWAKQNVAGKKHAKGSPHKAVLRPNHEYVLAFFKGEPYVDFPTYVFGEQNHLTLSTWIEGTDVEEINGAHWATFTNFWEISPANDADHPAVYPSTLAYRMLTRFTGGGDIVCDPWAGTGTTLVQCILTGRRYIGIELGNGYAGIALKNIGKAEKKATAAALAGLAKIEAYLKSKFVTDAMADDQ